MATELDLELGPVVTDLIDQFGAPIVLRQPLGSYVPALGRVVSFWGTNIAASGDALTRPAGDWEADGLEVGAWVNISGFRATGNNGWAKVTAVSALTATLARSFTAEAAGASVGIQLAADYAFRSDDVAKRIKGYFGSFEKRQIDGDRIKASDLAVYVDLVTIPAEPEEGKWWLFMGTDPATAKRLLISSVTLIYTGERAPLGILGARGT